MHKKSPPWSTDYKDLLRVRRIAMRTRAQAACPQCKAKKTKCSDNRPCKQCVGTVHATSCSASGFGSRFSISKSQQHDDERNVNIGNNQMPPLANSISPKAQKQQGTVSGTSGDSGLQGQPLSHHPALAPHYFDQPCSWSEPIDLERGLAQSTTTTATPGAPGASPVLVSNSWQHLAPLRAPLAASALPGLRLPATQSPLLPPLNIAIRGLSAMLTGQGPPLRNVLPTVGAARPGAASWP